jgi:hypothetical protein
MTILRALGRILLGAVFVPALLLVGPFGVIAFLLYEAGESALELMGKS